LATDRAAAAGELQFRGIRPYIRLLQFDFGQVRHKFFSGDWAGFHEQETPAGIPLEQDSGKRI
jgi:hypothetical protein